MARKTATKTATGVPFAQGEDKRRGVGKKGRSGRKPSWLKEFCDDLLADPKCKAAVRKILKNPAHPAFATMWGKVTDRAHGKPVQPIEHSVDGTLEEILARSRS
jgi:hypothetical protein